MSIFLVVGIFLPRLAAVILYFFSNWFMGVFSTWLWPVLGFLFMPYTMLWYSVVMNISHGVWGFWNILFLVIAICMDLSSPFS